MAEVNDQRLGKKGSGCYLPEEIAERVGGISVKSLAEVIRKAGLETTTLGHADPSKRGGPARRIWGMNEDQLQRLLRYREGRRRITTTRRPSEPLP